MKKLLALILIFALLVPAALALDIDLTALTDEELLALSSQVKKEAFLRRLPGEGAVTVPQGTYIAGEDFPAGRYTLTVAPGVLEVQINVNKPDAEIYELGDTFYLGTAYGTSTANVNLPEGYILTVTFADVYMRVFKSLF